MSAPPSRPLLTRLVFLLGLFGAALILAAAGAAAWGERARLFRDAEAEAQSTAAFLADHAGRLFEVADVALAATKAEVGEMGWSEIAASRTLHQHLRAIAGALPYVSAIWLNDDTGELRLTSLAFPTPVSDARDRGSFKQVMVPGSGLVVGDLITAKLTGDKTFLVARRLDGPDGGFRGMVSATAELRYFADYWSSLMMPYGGRVALLQPSSDQPLVQHSEAMAGPAASDLVATRPLATVPLLLRVSVPRGQVVRAWRDEVEALLPLVGAALLAMLGLTAFAFRQGRRESASLRDLQAARGALAAANAGLEATVAQRTAALQEASDEVRRFAYLVSHDLRGPLLNVSGFVGELGELRRELFAPVPGPGRDQASLAREFDEMLGFIRAGTAAADALLRHILALSREGERKLVPEPLDMTALVRGIADAGRFQAAQAGTMVDISTLPPITADRTAVERIFSNLIDNAVKYRDPVRPGRVEVSGGLEAGRAVYVVADNGRGIAPADLDRVFELFRRAGRQDTPGEGIGLAFVRTLARGLGGRVEVESDPGVGSRFRVTLPVVPTDEA